MELASLSDAPGSSVLLSAATWLQGTVLGTVATTVATIAISWLGMLMLAGRLEMRRGLAAIAGCFILFGASGIVGGMQTFIGSDARAAFAQPVPPLPPVPELARDPDPYAGASLSRPWR